MSAVSANNRRNRAETAYTPDENRLMLKYERDEITHLIPTNKEIQRAEFRARGIYHAIEEAKKIDKEKWKYHLMNFTTEQKLREAAEHSVEMMSNAIGTMANLALQKDVFDAKPLETWVDQFLPYASRVQDKAA